MAKLLISYYIQGRRDDPIGERIWEDGVAETYQTTQRIKGDDGVHRTVLIPPGWYQVATLGEAQLQAVRLAIKEAQVGEIPGNIPSLDPRYSDVSSAEWKIAWSRGLKKIRVAQWGPSLDEAAQPLLKLMLRMGAIVNVAAAGLDSVPD